MIGERVVHRLVRCTIHRRGLGLLPTPDGPHHRSVDDYHRLRLVAAVQDGVITAEQCRAHGVSPRQVKTWCRDKRWRRVNRGVYLVDADLYAEPPRRSL